MTREQLKDSKEIKQAAKLLSLAYLLNSLAIERIDDANELLKQIGCMQREIKFYANKMQKDFDLFNLQFKQMMNMDGNVAFSEDYKEYNDKLKELFKIK